MNHRKTKPYFRDSPLRCGTETQQFIGSLNRLRTTFRYKTDGLDDARLRRRFGPSTLTLPGLLKHLSIVETLYFDRRLHNAPLRAPWTQLAPTTDRHTTTDPSNLPASTLYQLYDHAVDQSNQRLHQTLTHFATASEHPGPPNKTSDPSSSTSSGIRPIHRPHLTGTPPPPPADPPSRPLA